MLTVLYNGSTNIVRGLRVPGEDFPYRGSGLNPSVMCNGKLLLWNPCMKYTFWYDGLNWAQAKGRAQYIIRNPPPKKVKAELWEFNGANNNTNYSVKNLIIDPDDSSTWEYNISATRTNLCFAFGFPELSEVNGKKYYGMAGDGGSATSWTSKLPGTFPWELYDMRNYSPLRYSEDFLNLLDMPRCFYE